MSRSTQQTYNMICFSTFFSYEEKHRSKATTTKYTKAFHIIYSKCVDLLIWSLTQLDFTFYSFIAIYHDFSKLFWDNLTDFEKCGDIDPFIG
jgi:hypothetical protein